MYLVGEPDVKRKASHSAAAQGPLVVWQWPQDHGKVIVPVISPLVCVAAAVSRRMWQQNWLVADELARSMYSGRLWVSSWKQEPGRTC